MKSNNQKPAKGNTGLKSENVLISRTNIIYCVRPSLSRRSKALINLLKSTVPEHDIDHLTHELASETHRDQNMMVDGIFASLVGSSKVCGPHDLRLIVKVTDLKDRLIADIDPFRLNRCE
jgi:hypothetical protein